MCTPRVQTEKYITYARFRNILPNMCMRTGFELK